MRSHLSSRSRWLAVAAAPVLLASTAAPADSLATLHDKVQIALAANGGCLADVEGKLTLATCAKTDTRQQWSTIPSKTEEQVKNVASGKCLGWSNEVRLEACLPVYGTTIWTISSRDGVNGFQLTSYDAPLYKHTQLTYCLAFTNDALVVEECKLDGQDAAVPKNVLWSAQSPADAPSTAQSTKARWSAPIGLNLVGVSAAHQPDGKVLFWSGSHIDRPGFHREKQLTYRTIFDPATNTAASATLDANPAQFHTQGQALDASGKLVVAGGRAASSNVAVVDASGAFTKANKLVNGRSFGTMVTLANGTQLMAGGQHMGRGDHPRAELRQGGVWTDLLNAQDYVVDTQVLGTSDPRKRLRQNNMWLFASSDEKYVFNAGPSNRMAWISTAGFGSLEIAAVRGPGDQIHGSAVMYAPGQLLVTGGVSKFIGTGETAKSNATIVTIEDRATGKRLVNPDVKSTGSMTGPRAFHNSIVLPTGDVLLVGGSRKGELYRDDAAVLTPEIWSPATGRFRALDVSMTIPRTYESTALLLPDGRVIVAGGGFCGKCKNLEPTRPHASVEILTPPYLLTADGKPALRPAIVSVPASVTAGGTIKVTVTGTSTPSFSLVRLSSTSRGINSDQRYLKIPKVESGKNGVFDFRVPAIRDGIVPGSYMLFAIDPAGVPSVAKIVQID